MNAPCEIADNFPDETADPAASSDVPKLERSSDSLPCTLPIAQVQVVDQKVPQAVVGRMISATSTPGLPADQTHPLRRSTNQPAPASPPAIKPPRLLVLRGLKLNVEYPLYEGETYVGRRENEPVDIDLFDQEPADHVWSSRRHAVLTLTNGVLTIEDLRSRNGTFVNRHRLYSGQKRALGANDIVQIGTVQLKVLM